MNTLGNISVAADIFKSSRLVNSNDLANAMQVAAKTGLPVERILVMLGFVTNEVAHAAAEAEWLIKDRLISFETACRAMTIVANYRIGFTEAVESLSSSKKGADSEMATLGDLLVAAELIDTQQLKDALTSSQHLGLPLGRMLVLKGTLPMVTVEAALNAQVMMRDGAINRKQAIEALQTSHNHACSMDVALAEIGSTHSSKCRSAKLGEIFVLSGVVTEADMLTALEVGLLDQEPIGQVMLKLGFISEEMLEAGLTLQRMMGHRSITLLQSVEALKQMQEGGLPLAQAVAEISDPQVREGIALGLIELLHRSDLVRRNDGEKAMAMSYATKESFGDVMLRLGLISQLALETAIRCQLLISEGLITKERAILALHHWQLCQLSLADILTQLESDDGAPANSPFGLADTKVLLVQTSWF